MGISEETFSSVSKNKSSLDVYKRQNMYFKPDARITDMEYLKTYNIFKLGDIAFEGNKSKDFSFGRFVENTIGDGIVSDVYKRQMVSK